VVKAYSHVSARRHGFSLLELLVVFAIAGIAVGVIVPTVSRLRSRSRGISCEANLQRIAQGVLSYCADNNGWMPYGQYYQHSDPVTWEDAGTDGKFICWISLINSYLGGTGDIVVDPVDVGQGLSAAFQCPEAELVAPHPVSYVMNFAVAITPRYELLVGEPPNAQSRPARQSMMLSFGTALVWDTAVRSTWQNDLGHVTGADLDTERFWFGALTPQFRYYLAADPLAQFGSLWGNERPVLLNVSQYKFYNIDPTPQPAPPWPYQGNLRFRHGGTVCNAAFADGSVRQFTATVRPDLTVSQHDAIRKHFMIEWAPGAVPNPAYPSWGPPKNALPIPRRGLTNESAPHDPNQFDNGEHAPR
jgi:prepilin-type processing-associated H-X9-DG protein/prepilin-type N-terminal cleavage/methylation domain-containing protein